MIKTFLLAAALAFTAHASAQNASSPAKKELVAKIRDQVGRLRALCAPLAVDTSADYGLAPDMVEAAAFAWLARQAIEGIPASLAAVTGASGPRVLGAVYPK